MIMIMSCRKVCLVKVGDAIKLDFYFKPEIPFDFQCLGGAAR